eukprot:156824-Prymnesium_polylepis.2
MSLLRLVRSTTSRREKRRAAAPESEIGPVRSAEAGKWYHRIRAPARPPAPIARRAKHMHAQWGAPWSRTHPRRGPRARVHPPGAPHHTVSEMTRVVWPRRGPRAHVHPPGVRVLPPPEPHRPQPRRVRSSAQTGARVPHPRADAAADRHTRSTKSV